MDQPNWDNMRVLLAVARRGTVRAAAQALGTSHSTILRRIESLEESLNARLFERTRDGYVATRAGRETQAAAERLEECMVDLATVIRAQDQCLSGYVRVTLPDVLLSVVLKAAPSFAREFPKIKMEFSTTAEVAHPSVDAADVALWVGVSPSPELFGRCIGTAQVGVYAARSYLERHGPMPRENYHWLGWERNNSGALGKWILRNIPEQRVLYRFSTPGDLTLALTSGLGVTLVPAVVANRHPDWVCIQVIDEMRMPIWVLSPEGLRRCARARAVREFLVRTIRELSFEVPLDENISAAVS